MKVKVLRKKLSVANAYRTAANSLTWGEQVDGVIYDVCVCGTICKRSRPSEMVHVLGCMRVTLRNKADQIEADIESEIAGTGCVTLRRKADQIEADIESEIERAG